MSVSGEQERTSDAGETMARPIVANHFLTRLPEPRSSHWFQAFSFDTWDQVTAFYEERLPGWKVTRQATVVVFEKEPDQAAITISPWAYQDLPDDAPRVLREARTAIGAAWD